MTELNPKPRFDDEYYAFVERHSDKPVLPNYATQEQERRQLACCVLVTLDGRKARISGIQNDYATVLTLDDKSESSFEFSWPTVHRTIANGGQFKS